jgi:hypothetical protein
MFDFVSACHGDALSSSGTELIHSEEAASAGNGDSWSSDPKRKSVKNLMDQLTPGQVPPSTQASQMSQNRFSSESPSRFHHPNLAGQY